MESGVRFVTVYYTTGNNQPWDTHTNHDKEHRKLCVDGDQAAAALISDLKSRGLLFVKLGVTQKGQIVLNSYLNTKIDILNEKYKNSWENLF